MTAGCEKSKPRPIHEITSPVNVLTVAWKCFQEKSFFCTNFLECKSSGNVDTAIRFNFGPSVSQASFLRQDSVFPANASPIGRKYLNLRNPNSCRKFHGVPSCGFTQSAILPKDSVTPTDNPTTKPPYPKAVPRPKILLKMNHLINAVYIGGSNKRRRAQQRCPC